MDEHGRGNYNNTLKALSEQFAKIGWDKKLQHLTADDAVAIIDAIQSVNESKHDGILDLNPNTDIADDEIPF
tara:strand:+ start:4822 stop:5037 length:216 start_codon:yes stop_codon:yes gene_type:complete